MILIFSQDFEPTTDAVIDWINYYSYPFCRINPNDLINCNFKLDIENNCFTIDTINGVVSSKQVKSIWFRKWHNLSIVNKDIVDQHLLIELNKAIENEFVSIFKSIEYCLKDKFWLNKFEDTQNPKIKQLHFAKEVGLDIPKTFVFNNKKDVLNLFSENKSILTKATQHSINYKDYTEYTNRISVEIIDEMPDIFFPSLFQIEVEKDIELRIVYVDGVFYTMAIFSQQNEQTSIDFRRYDFDYPNRTVSFELPIKIKSKISKLMKILDLNFGSIDMIKTKNGEYYFLEVNPVGQFGMVSSPCNYNIEQIIAQKLINNG